MKKLLFAILCCLNISALYADTYGDPYTHAPTFGYDGNGVVQTLSYSGKVTDEDSKPLDGVTISSFIGNANIYSTKSTSDGNFTLVFAQNKFKNKTTLVVKYDLAGYQTVSNTYPINNGDSLRSINFDVTMKKIVEEQAKSALTISGKVADDERNALKNVTVSLVSNSIVPGQSSVVATAKTGKDGKYTLTIKPADLRGGKLTIKFELNGFEPYSFSFKDMQPETLAGIQDNFNPNLKKLADPVAIKGEVKLESGMVPSGLKLTMTYDNEKTEIAQQKVGEFKISKIKLVPGTKITFSVPGFEDGEYNVEKKDKDIQILLKRKLVTITGEFYFNNNIIKKTCVIKYQGRNGTDGQLSTSLGTFKLDKAVQTYQNITVTCDGFKPTTYEVKDKDATDIKIKMESNGSDPDQSIKECIKYIVDRTEFEPGYKVSIKKEAISSSGISADYLIPAEDAKYISKGIWDYDAREDIKLFQNYLPDATLEDHERQDACDVAAELEKYIDGIADLPLVDDAHKESADGSDYCLKLDDKFYTKVKCELYTAEVDVTIKGTVTDNGGGPLADITVSVNGQSASTDENGGFEINITNVQVPGKITLKYADASGQYDEKVKHIELTKEPVGNTIEVETMILPKAGTGGGEGAESETLTTETKSEEPQGPSQEELEQKARDSEDAYNAAKEKQNSAAQRLLTATTTLATSEGAMAALSARSEQRIDEEAEQDMSAYLQTFRCDYGKGVYVPYGPAVVDLPGGNDLLKYYTEYAVLANRVKATKQALNLKLGIESEVILDKAEGDLYSYNSGGPRPGAYASLARALTDANSADAAVWAKQKSDSKEKFEKGSIAAVGGLAVGIGGNLLLNSGKDDDTKLQRSLDSAAYGIDLDNLVGLEDIEESAIKTDKTTTIDNLIKAFNSVGDKLESGQKVCIRLVGKYDKQKYQNGISKQMNIVEKYLKKEITISTQRYGISHRTDKCSGNKNCNVIGAEVTDCSK